MPSIVHHHKRSKQYCRRLDASKSLKYAILGAFLFLIVLFVLSSTSSENASSNGNKSTSTSTRIKTVKEQVKPYYPENEQFNPVVPMDDDFYTNTNDDTNDDTNRDNDDTTSTPATVKNFKTKTDKNGTIIQSNTITADDDDDHSMDFINRHCDLTDVDAWWPTAGHDDWRTRTPYFLLIGAKKAGTTSLSSWITQHPLIAPPRTKELLYFLPRRFEQVDPFTSKIKVANVRQDMYDNDYNVERLQNEEGALSFEATPGYVLFSTLSRIPILCTMPWVKLLITLRHPVDRIFSNYNFLLDSLYKRRERQAKPTGGGDDTWNIPMPSLDDFIMRDIQQLKEAGVLRNHDTTSDDASSSSSFYGSLEERKAWTNYQRIISAGSTTNEAPVGRSLYILQVQEWWDSLAELGRDPSTDIMVVRNEEMKADPGGVYQKILWWLELPEFTPPSAYKSQMVTQYRSEPMSNKTKQMLYDLYRPYNKRLYKLLGWDDGIWDDDGTVATKANTIQPEQLEQEEREEELEEEEEEVNEEGMNDSQIAHLYDPPDYDEERGTNFTNQWCLLNHGVSWYPPPHALWQLRAPYFLLPGAKKSGTTALASYLIQHPLVAPARTKELQFFLNKNFRAKYVDDETRRTTVWEAREHLYAMEYNAPLLRHNASLISMDATPGYLFHSAMLPQRILCVTPWVKLVIILRDPVDRVYSNWAYALWRTGNANNPAATSPGSFERVMRADMALLEQSGFLKAGTAATGSDDDKNRRNEEEAAAWATYLGLKREGVVGRSLYEIQLRQWFQAIRDVGRDPTTQVYIVRSEDLKRDIQGEMKKVHAFLGLPYVRVENEEEKVVSHYSSPMSNETRLELEKFFAPYNEKLYSFLVDHGFGKDWKGYWKPKVLGVDPNTSNNNNN